MIWKAYLRFAIGRYASDIPPSWRLVCATLPNALHHRLIEPAWTSLRRRLPVWVALMRLEREGDWYRIPDVGAAVHASLKFNEILREGDYIKVGGGRVVAVGWKDGKGIEFVPCQASP